MKIHAVDAGNQRRRYPDDGNDRQHLEGLVLVHVDEAERSIEQELHLLGKVRLVLVERGNICLHGREPIAKLFLGRAQGAQPAWVDGGPGLVVPIGGQPIAVFRFKTKNGVIAEIDVTCNVQTIEAMKLEY